MFDFSLPYQFCLPLPSKLVTKAFSNIHTKSHQCRCVITKITLKTLLWLETIDSGASQAHILFEHKISLDDSIGTCMRPTNNFALTLLVEHQNFVTFERSFNREKWQPRKNFYWQEVVSSWLCFSRRIYPENVVVERFNTIVRNLFYFSMLQEVATIRAASSEAAAVSRDISLTKMSQLTTHHPQTEEKNAQSFYIFPSSYNNNPNNIYSYLEK